MKLTTLDSGEAFDVTGADRFRFNEAVSAGHLKVVPPTGVGKSRQFTPPHLKSLFCFQRHLTLGDPPRRAGEFASLIAELLVRIENKKKAGTLSEIVIAYGMGGAVEVHLGGPLPSDALVKGEPLFMQMIYSLENIETLLSERITELNDQKLKPAKSSKPRRRRWGED
ncbi:MAG: hypothetical protein EON61_00765 [Alphaproteobacteria bacterium]|nr:MAG: hypothetical protein EON61_00765 [Alphaproteobacteria bacterium]